MRIEGSHELRKRRGVWERKRIIREVYSGWFSEIKRYLIPGTVLELGAGIGIGKEFIRGCIETDIIYSPWVDIVVDAQNLPFRSDSISNIICIDLLHHLRRPVHLFTESERILIRGGRIVILEPYISPISYLIFRIFHHERVSFNDDPLRDNGVKIPENQALSYLMFFKYQKNFEIRFPALKIIEKRVQDLFFYPLSGGFKRISFIPPLLTRHIKKAETLLHPLRRILGFRVFIVLERWW